MSLRFGQHAVDFAVVDYRSEVYTQKNAHFKYVHVQQMEFLRTTKRSGFEGPSLEYRYQNRYLLLNVIVISHVPFLSAFLCFMFEFNTVMGNLRIYINLSIYVIPTRLLT